MLMVGSNLIFVLWIAWVSSGILFTVKEKKGVNLIIFVVSLFLMCMIYYILLRNGFTDRDISQHIFFLKIFLSHGKMPHEPYRLLKHVIYSCPCRCCH